MTAVAKLLTGAALSEEIWKSINWKSVEAEVRQLQMRIAKANREGRHGKVKALPWILTHSYSAKLIAVKRVTQNKGAKTPGVDQIVWETAHQKLQAVKSLKRKGYQTLPLRRIYIPKKDGHQRPLSIPSMNCRAALYLLALEPIAENCADQNSYGFRPKRSAADAIGRCFNALASKGSAQYILEADIKSCFDKISHKWMQNNIPMDQAILNKWLAAGYIDKDVLHQTEVGAPQGGIASPTFLNITLSGLEDAVISATSIRNDKVHIGIYADDFIITGKTQEVLEETIKPVVEAFLSERGLELSKEKTKITQIDEGFDFLGVNIRKYKGKLIIKPSKKSIKNFLDNIRKIIKSNPTAKTENLINQLNPKIRGWANYFRTVCAKKTFSYIDACIFRSLWKWTKRRHPNKSSGWLKKKYFWSHGLRNWMFYAKISKGNNPPIYLDLFLMSSVAIVRHVKIRKEATPFDPRFTEYFKQRDCCQNKTKPSAKYAATNLQVAQSKCVKLAGSTDVGL